MKSLKIALVALSILIVYSCSSDYQNLDDGLYAEFKTSKGDFIAELYYDKVPMTVGNFVALAQGVHPLTEKRYQDRKLYDSLLFHRVLKDSIIQGGDPRGTGRGGPGFTFPDETTKDLTHNDKGILSMANSDLEESKVPYSNFGETNGSQFFITLKATPELDGLFSVFGKIIQNQAVVDSIGLVKTNKANRPVDKVFIKEVNIIRKGSKAKEFDAVTAFEEGVESHKNRLQKEATKRQELIEEISEGYQVTESGLRYQYKKRVENGDTPKPNDIVKVHYEGFLIDSTKFDSSYERGEPLEFELGVGKVIPGWDEGLQLLKKGEKASFIIPPYLSYNERAAGPVPPYSILIFDVELVDIIRE